VADHGHDARLFAGCRIASLGSATTAAVNRFGLLPDLEAAEFSSGGLVEAFKGIDCTGAKILLPRAEGGSPELVTGLEARGATVDELVLYESRPPQEVDREVLRLVREGRIDVATFASSSSVRNLASILAGDIDVLGKALIVSIGPVTSQAIREQGLNVEIEAAEHTIPGLIEALKAHFASSVRAT
jgi:uroporphyrinogen III methyltransferase/synthase